MPAVYISFVRPVNYDSVSALLNQCNVAVAGGFNEINILISSPGGDLIPGFGAYHQLLGMPAEIVTHNIGSIDSIANIIFLAGKRRYACAASSFLFHGTHWNFGGAAVIKKPQLGEIVDSLEVDEGKMKDIIILRCKLTREELDKMMLSGETLSAPDAKASELIHDIREVNIPSNTPIRQI